MDSSDLTEPFARNVPARDPPSQRSQPNQQPGLECTLSNDRRQSASSQRMKSSFSQYPSNGAHEGTPINRGSNSTRRHYDSTESLRQRQSRESRSKSAIEPEENGHGDVPNPPADQVGEPRVSWYSGIAERFGSMELENKGSVARDHLALERTFLAWLRTSLAFASIGIAVTQLFRLNSAGTTVGPKSADVMSQSYPNLLWAYEADSMFTMDKSERLRSIGKPLGTTFIGVAIVILLVGFHRYFESQYWIIRGKFPASRGSIFIIAFIAAALIIAALVVILAISPGSVES